MTTPNTEQRNDAVDLRPWGYAPGNYSFRCMDCPEPTGFDGYAQGDKRSIRCEKHALEVRAAAFTPEQIAAANAETDRLCRELDIANADHIALWLEANMAGSSLAWLSCRIVEAHEAALSPSPASSPVGEGLISELTDALEDAKNNGFGEEFFRRAVNDLLARARAYPSVTERRSVGRLSKAVVSLVIAAREAWEVDCVSGDDLDKALEPFAALVPYENEPDREALSPLSGEPEAYYADDEPLSAEDQARIDAAWEKHKAADPVCRIPPEGWSCSRAAGHEGPCAASPLGEPASVAVEADNCDKCDDSGYIRENGRQEFCDCICGHDAMDQAEGVGLHALSKPTPVEAKPWYKTDAHRDLSRIIPDMEGKIAEAKTRYAHCLPDHLFAPLEASITELRVLRHEVAAQPTPVEAGLRERDMFEAGFMASWSEMYVKSDGNPAFELSDAALDRAWDIYLATRDEAALSETPPPPSQEGGDGHD